MRVFVSALDSYVGAALRQTLKSLDEDVEITIVGTVEDGANAGNDGVTLVGSSSVADLARSADAIVIDLARPNADTALVIDAFRTGRFEDEKSLIGVSSCLVWGASTKPRDGGDFSETAYKRRKPTPRFMDTKTLESHVLSLARDGLRAHVVGCGIMYGQGEQDLHFLFKDAWICESPALQLPSLEGRGGSNVLPMVHVSDACQIITKVVQEDPGKPYLLAIDNAKSTLAEVVKALSTALGPAGAVEPMTAVEADAALVSTPGVDVLQSDLAFDTDTFTANDLGVEWVAQEGFVESIDAVVTEYIKERRLTPVRTALLGPPGSGKSHIGRILGVKYYLPVITTGDAVALALGSASDETKAAIGHITWPEGLQERVTEVITSGSRLSTHLLARVVRSVLAAPRVRNRGYVLDGFPRTYAEAKALCVELEEDAPLEPEEPEEPPAEDEPDEDEVTLDTLSTPTSVVVFDGAEEVLKARIMALPESATAGTHDTEDGFTRRTHKYREDNKPEAARNTVLFFEEKAGVEVLEVTVDDTTDAEATVERVLSGYVEKGGTPFNYHPTEEEVAAAEAAAKAEADAKADAEQRERDAEAAREAAARAARDQENSVRAAAVAKQEAALLEARSAPLRKYLVANVIPSLTQGLLEVAKVKPSDPVDYLAEFLFKTSPPEGE